MTRSLLEHINSGVEALSPYEPGKPVEELERELGISDIVKLASNENPLGASPSARRVLAEWGGDLGRYPDGNGHALKTRLAAIHDIDPGRITLGNGSNDVLDLVARVFLGPGRAALFARHAFAVYPIVTLAANAEPREAAALAPDHPEMPYGHDLDAMADALDDDVRVVFLASPNNPTGTWLAPAAIEAFLDRVPDDVVVVLDEAYREYLDPARRPDSRAWLERYDNLVVTRTFSKIYGLAGLRVGYALSSPALADRLNRVRQPFNVNLLGQACALAALDDDGFVSESAALNAAQRDLLARELAARGLPALPSQANFLTFACGREGAPVYRALLREGVIVRPLAGYGLPDHLRVTVGTEAENRRFLAALDAVTGT